MVRQEMYTTKSKNRGGVKPSSRKSGESKKRGNDKGGKGSGGKTLSKQRVMGVKGSSGSSTEWLRRQLSDPWAKLAADSHYASRSAFKLIQIDDKHKFLKPGRNVIDCGARPGGWSQVAVERCCSRKYKAKSTKPFTPGIVISVDICDMHPVSGAILVKGDFTEASTQAVVSGHLNGKLADVILSDMAPSASGQQCVDFDRIMVLCDAVLYFAETKLASGGTLVVKILGGGDIKEFRGILNKKFETVKFAKPEASRSTSSESFIIAKGFNPPRLTSHEAISPQEDDTGMR
eukprot:CFRG2468T1